MITMDCYGHLMPGAEDQAAGLLDAFLQSARAASPDVSAELAELH